jgi:hypothetical protein
VSGSQAGAGHYTVRPRIVAYLRRQAEPRRIGRIAYETQCSAQTVRAVLDDLDRAGRVRVTGPARRRLYLLTDVRETRVSIRDAPEDGGGWWEPETVDAAVMALRALADDRTLGTIGPDGRARLAEATAELTAALGTYDKTGT